LSGLISGCSWSSGKDSCFACYKAIKEGYKIKYLLNFISEEFKRVSFHGTHRKLVEKQAESIGVKLLQREVPKDLYEKTFRESLRYLKSQGIFTLIAGDIYLLDCKNWVERVCDEEGLKVVEPLWERKSKDVLTEFVDSGFKAIVTATQAKLLDKSWIGRVIDKDFIQDLEKKQGIDLCGENGEYHTFIFDGPIFKKKIEILKTNKIQIGNYNFLDIQEYKFKGKDKK